MLLSGIMLKMALFSIIKWQLPIAPHFAEKYKYIFIALCVAGVIYGSVLALKQTNLKSCWLTHRLHTWALLPPVLIP